MDFDKKKLISYIKRLNDIKDYENGDYIDR